MTETGAPAQPLPPCRLIVAMTEQRLMGREGDLPWHLPEDLAHFKRTTLGGTVVMGRLSFESVGGRPLPKRTNLVVSRSVPEEAARDGQQRDAVRWFPSLSAACAWTAREAPGDDGSAWILGGAALFREVLAPLDDGPGAHAARGLPRPRTLIVTWVPEQPLQPCDVLFPFDRAWIERHYRVVDDHPGEAPGLRFTTYELR